MSILALLHRILDHLPCRPDPADEEAARPDIRIVSMPRTQATRALAEALRAAHSDNTKS
ncbi:hypothetical protein [Labrys sp. (in: a-proteobacteria)]|uniref:hypothetical protein n=1 Tax=Labrys sp. (in: a-proteobacteria) TaxID=1917972 RepID=UPI0039E62281